MFKLKYGKCIQRIGLLALILIILTSFMVPAGFAAEATQVPETNVVRIFGATRYQTALNSADAFLELQGREALDSIILASGLDFADALAGSHLAVVKNAPILLSNGRNTSELHTYIRTKLKAGGTVYILGGEKAMPASVTQGLNEYTVKRLSGATRYETNLAILQEAGVTGSEIIVCTGDNFADSLSASAVGKPILLVNNKKGALTQIQETYLKNAEVSKIYILGGVSAVSQKLEAQLKTFGDVERIGGATRYDTSVLVAEKFFPEPKSAVITYALTYPDGLCGGLLAHQMNGPMLLTRNENAAAARKYVQDGKINAGVVMGGEILISNDSVRYIFGTVQTEPEKPATYEITYALYGGENSSANPAQYIQGSSVTLAAPTRADYTFDGWYLESTFSTKVDQISAEDSGNLTLHAKWIPNRYTVSYILDGGTNSDENPDQYVYGTGAALHEASKEHFTFDGWYLDDTFTTKVTSLTATDSGNITLYAKWLPNQYTISYVLDGGTNSEDNPTKFTYGQTVVLQDPAKEGSTFAGWYCDSTFETKITEITKENSGDMTLYALWKSAYSITYVLDGGRNNPRNPSEYIPGDVIPLQSASKAYNTFDGWYLEPTFDTKVTGIQGTDSGDLTLYAKWIPFSYTITYELNKGENSKNNLDTYSYGDSFTLEAPTRENHTFDGWYLESSFKNRVENISSVSSGNITLYAKWHLSQLNIPGEGMDNMIWSWWYYPQVISTDTTVYWGYADNDGYCGVAAYDIAKGKTTTTALKRLSVVDDHNGLGLTILKDGRIMCVYAGGHDSNYEMHVRISEKPYDISNFSTNLILKSAGKTCYGQIIQQNGKIYIFYRINSKSWGYRSSEDGINWSKEVIMVSAAMQYYCKVMPTTQEGLVRVCMYSNPTAGDCRIRMGFLDLNTGTLYNADRTTPLGKERVSYLNFDVILDVPEGKVQRMFDVAITAPETTRILYATFTSDKTANDSEYYLYDSGKSVRICSGGVPLWNPKYQGGASFAGDDCIVLARNASGTDYVEVYDYRNNSVTLRQSVWNQKVGGGGIRNARPIVDINGKAFLWHSGYYNPNSYKDFSTDAMIAFLK